MNSKIGKNTIFNTIKTISNVIYPLITFPYISRILLPENIGKINFGNSIISYFSLAASLGISTYAIRECSKVKNEKDKLENLSSEILSINIITTLIAYIVLIFTLIFAKSLEGYRQLICIQSTTILFATLGADWLNTSLEDFKYITFRTVGTQILSLVFLFVFIHKPEDYILYAALSVVASSGANILNIVYRKKICKVRFTFNINIKKHLPPILLLFSLLLTQTIYCNSDITMIGLIKGDLSVGLYSTSVKIYNLVNQVIASIAFVVMPQLSQEFSNNNFVEINKTLKHALNFIVILGVPCLVGLNTIAIPIIATVGGLEYIGANVSLHILTASLACSFIGGWVTNMILLPSGKEKLCLIGGIVSAIINIALNFIVIPKYDFNGAALTTFISEFIGLCICIHFIDKSIKINGLIKMIRAPLAGSVMIIICGLILRKVFSSYIIITSTTIFISTIVYVVILYLFKDEFFLSYAAPIVEKVKRRKHS